MRQCDCPFTGLRPWQPNPVPQSLIPSAGVLAPDTAEQRPQRSACKRPAPSRGAGHGNTSEISTRPGQDFCLFL